MNPFTIYRDHDRLEHDMRFHYTDAKAEAYIASMDKLNKIRIPLRHSATVLMALIALASAAYNLYRTFDDTTISLIETAFPFLAIVCTHTLRRINHNLGSQYWKQAIKNIENAKHISELMNRTDTR